jgi:Divergent InlB B-repeat domain
MQRFFSTFPYSRTLCQLGSIACAAVLLVACGSGGGGGGGGTPPAAATFLLTVTLASGSNSGTGTVSSNPAGLTCAPTPNPTACTGSFDQGTVVTLTATPTATNAFAGWSGGGCTGVGTCSVTMNAATAVTATFNGPTATPTIAVTVNGSGSGSVTSDVGGINCPAVCSATVSNSTAVTLTATATAGSVFQGWTGGGGSCTGTSNPCTFTPSADTSIAAAFFKPTLTVTVTGSGFVSSAPPGINGCTSAALCSAQFSDNSTVTLTATIPAGNAFSGWSFTGAAPAGTCAGTTNPCQITPLTTNVAVTAVITPLVANPTVTVTFGNTLGGTGSVSSTGGATNFTTCNTASCVATYVSGGHASITATATAGSLFTGWTAGPCSGTTTSPCVVNPILANQTMTASFTRPVLTVTMVGTGTVSSSGSVTGANTNCTGSCTRAFNLGETVTLTALSTAGFAFQGWTGGLGTSCTGGATGSCSFLMPAGGTAVTATFNNVVSTAQNFKFIGAAGNQLLAINPQASPATPTAVQVNGSPITLPNFVGSNRDGGAALIRSATSYDAGTTSFLGIKEDTIIFTSGGKIYKASTLLTNGVPGVDSNNVPQQVSSLGNPGQPTAQPCGMGSLSDLMNTSDRIIGFTDAGGDGDCTNGNEFLYLMRLSDGPGKPAVSLPVGTDATGDTVVFNLTTGAASRGILKNAAGNLQWIDNTLALPTNITGGGAVGPVTTVGTQADKVFLASSTKLYIYTPSTNTLSAPVVTADGGTTWVPNSNNNDLVSYATTSSAIYLVQTNGDVYRVSLTTTAGQTVTTKHFMADPGTIASSIAQTPLKIMIRTGKAPSGSFGQDPCSTTNPTTCNNGIIAVDKTAPNTSVPIETAAPNKLIFSMTSWNNFITYTLSGGGALARIENASAGVVTVSTGNWNNGTIENSFNITTLADQTPVNQVITEFTGGTANGALVKVATSPTGSAVPIGTVSDPTSLLQSGGFFDSSVNGVILGYLNFAANPTNRQPFLVDTTLNTLTKITTPGAPTAWRAISSN